MSLNLNSRFPHLLACVHYTSLQKLREILQNKRVAPATRASNSVMFCADPASYVCLSGYGPGDLEKYREFGEAGEREHFVELMEDADSVMLALHPRVVPDTALIYRSHDDPALGYHRVADCEAADHYSDGEIIVEGGLAFAEGDVLALVYSAPTCKVSEELRELGYRVASFAEFASELGSSAVRPAPNSAAY